MNKATLLLGIGLAATALQTGAQSGVPLWTNLYGGSPGGYDQPSALVSDSSGDVIVTGYVSTTNSHSDFATIKYSSAGVPLWTNIFNDVSDHNDNASAIAVNSSADVFVTGASVFINGPYFTTHYTTLAYTSTGVPLWTNRYAYGNTLNSAAAVAVDSSDNVVVTGSSIGGQFSYSYATVAYSSAGVPLWTNRYNGGSPVDLDAHAVAVVPDANGNVFVTGYSSGMGSGFDYATLKYSGAGVRLWVNRYNGPGNGDDYARAMAVDGGGNVFVTGYCTNSDSGYDYATVAYSNNGAPLWTNRYNGPGNGDDYARAIAVDKGGTVFVTGYSSNSDSGYDYATVAYSNIGTPLWTNRYNGAGNGDDYARAIAVDSGGNVFVTGYCTNTDSRYDFATVAYSSAGLPLWTNSFSGPTDSYDQATALTVDGNGNLFVSGISLGSGQDYTTINYSSSLPPPVRLGFQVRSNQMLLDWTNTGFVLQSAPTITGTFTNVPGATSPYTIFISGPQAFFRLISN